MGLYFGPQAQSSKKITVSISLQSKAIRSYLESPGEECISQVPENREDVGQNHDARKTISATLSVLK